MALDQRGDPRRRPLDAIVERVLLDHQHGIFRRIGGEGADEFVDESRVAAVARMHHKLRVAGLLQQREKYFSTRVRQFERARQNRALVMRHAPEIFADVAKALAIDGIAVIFGVEPEERLERDRGEEVVDRVDDVRPQARREIARIAGLRRALTRFQIDLGIARQAREAVDAVALQRDPMRTQVAIFQHEAVQAKLLGHFERAAIPGQSIVESNDRIDFVATHCAAQEPLPVAVAMAIENAAMAWSLKEFAAFADRAEGDAARRLDLARQPREEGTKRGADEKKDRHPLSHPLLSRLYLAQAAGPGKFANHNSPIAAK